MKKIALLLLLLPLNFISQTNNMQTAKPKLVVGLVIDQMRYDYIGRFWDKFGDNGFRKLVRKGFFSKNAHFNYVPTYTAPGHASIYTGTCPSVHGIVGNDWYERDEKREVYCVEDSSVSGVGTESDEAKASPARLLVTTLGDELKISNNSKSKVIAIALKDRSAILPGGHMANGAYWFDASNGNFVSSSYYMNSLPNWVTAYNSKQNTVQYLKKGWSLLLPPAEYTESIADDNNFEESFQKNTKAVFPYEYSTQLGNKNYGVIRSTPWGNTITREFAIEALNAEQLGKDEYTDLLCISFSSTDYVGHMFGPHSVELEDVYIRLDKEIEVLLNELNNKVGEENYLLFLTADHGASENPAYLQQLRIPSGITSSRKIVLELKQQLAAKFTDSLILDYENQQLYLDEETVNKKKHNMDDVLTTSIQLLQSYKWVYAVYNSSMLQAANAREGTALSLYQRGYHPKRGGNLAVAYLPSWMSLRGKGTTHGSEYSYDTHVPLIFYGKGILPYSTSRKISIEDIAPTLSLILNISFPNGSAGEPIHEIIH